MPSRHKLDSGVAPKTSCLRSFLGSSSRQYEDGTCLKPITARVASSQDFDDYYASKIMADDEKKTKGNGRRFRVLKCFTEVPPIERDDITLHSSDILISKGQRKKSKSHSIGNSQLNEYKAPEILKIHTDVQSNNTDCTMNTTITEDEPIKNTSVPKGSRFNNANQRTLTSQLDVDFNTKEVENFFSCSFTNFNDSEQCQSKDDFAKKSVKPLSNSMDKSSKKKYHTPTRHPESHHFFSKNESTIQRKTMSNSLTGHDSPTQSKKSINSFPKYNSPTSSRMSNKSLPKFDSQEKRKANTSFSRHHSSAISHRSSNSKHDSPIRKRDNRKSTSKPNSPSRSRKTTYSEKKTSKYQSKNIHKAINQKPTRQRSSSNMSAARSQSHSSFGELTTEEEEEFLDSLANVLTANDKSQSMYDDLLSDIDRITGKTKKEREKERSVEIPTFIGLEIHAHSDHKLGDNILNDLDDTRSLSSISLQKPFSRTPPDGGSKIHKKIKKKESQSNNEINKKFAHATSSLLEKYIPDKKYETFDRLEKKNEDNSKKSSNAPVKQKKYKENFKHRHSTEKDSSQSSDQDLNLKKMTVEDMREKQEILNRLRNGDLDVGNRSRNKRSEAKGKRASFNNLNLPPPPPPPISKFGGDEDELPPLLFPEEHLPFDESPEKSTRKISHYSNRNLIM